ncbi:hypothetical protein SAMN02745220_05182 [Desulfopila aestuarii DSM 18488]|uniref:Uncharacterized protein n=1 Tax=Desulfopila aestuarii DSM 18488 TaxID=1121416 RepID=A0A1M7YLL6_9BACT|nr:hypothetical protein SAMN02745220_05182 [Desulfopila aestuarii DSM 18488]
MYQRTKVDVDRGEAPGSNLPQPCSPQVSIYPDIPRLFMFGYTANVIVHHGVWNEVVHFLQKPFSSKGLGDRLFEIFSS